MDFRLTGNHYSIYSHKYPVVILSDLDRNMNVIVVYLKIGGIFAEFVFE